MGAEVLLSKEQRQGSTLSGISYTLYQSTRTNIQTDLIEARCAQFPCTTRWSTRLTALATAIPKDGRFVINDQTPNLYADFAKVIASAQGNASPDGQYPPLQKKPHDGDPVKRKCRKCQRELEDSKRHNRESHAMCMTIGEETVERPRA